MKCVFMYDLMHDVKAGFGFCKQPIAYEYYI